MILNDCPVFGKGSGRFPVLLFRLFRFFFVCFIHLSVYLFSIILSDHFVFNSFSMLGGDTVVLPVHIDSHRTVVSKPLIGHTQLFHYHI